LQKWIENELRGYKIDDEIPQYRKGIAYNIRYSGINGNFTVKSVPLSESFFTDEIKKKYAQELSKYFPNKKR